MSRPLNKYPEVNWRLMAARMVELREEQGLQSAIAAARMGVDKGILWRLEHGETRAPMLHNLIKAADLYDCSLDYLVGRSNERGHRRRKT